MVGTNANLNHGPRPEGWKQSIREPSKKAKVLLYRHAVAALRMLFSLPRLDPTDLVDDHLCIGIDQFTACCTMALDFFADIETQPIQSYLLDALTSIF